MRNVPISEVWVDIEGYEGYYQVSNKGRVRSLDRVVPCSRTGTRKLRSKLLSLCKDSHGYVVVVLQKNSTKKSFKVHRLVALHFLRKVEGKDVVNHIDCNKSNNSINNLEWCTSQENTAHMHRLGRNYAAFGEKNPAYKLTDDQVKEIRALSKTMKRKDIAKMFNVSTQQIDRIVTFKQRILA